MVQSEFGIIVLYVIGMALSIAEIFLPGAIAGILGVLCIVASIYMAFTLPGALGWILTAITVAFVPIFIIFWLKVLNRMFALKFTQVGYTAAQTQYKELIGKEGVALTQLRPAGMARVGEQKVDVVSEGEVVERDARIRVVAVEGNRIVVRAIKG